MQHLFDLPGDIRASQPALAVATVEPRFQFAFAKGLITFTQEWFPLAATDGREGIAQQKGDKLGDIRRVEMREVTAFVPAKKTLLSGFGIRAVVPFSFRLDELLQTRIVRRAKFVLTGLVP